MEAPDQVAVARVQPEGSPRADLHSSQSPGAAPPARREVDEPGEDGRRAGDPRRSAEPPARLSGAGVERDEGPVPGPDEDRPPPDRGRRVDVRPDLSRPEKVAGRRAEGVHRPVRVPDEDPPVGDGRRRVEVLAPSEPRERRRVPALPSGLGVDAVHAAVARRDVERAARIGGRSDDLVVGRERPAQERLALAAQPVRVEAPVPGAEVEVLAGDHRRRLHRAGLDAPVLLAVAGVPGHDEPLRAGRVLLTRQPVHVRLVDDAVLDRRRRRRAVREVPRPDDLPRARVQREEPPLLLRDVHLAVGDRGRELDVGSSLQLPEPDERRPQTAPARCEMRPLRVVAVRRPLLLVQPPRQRFGCSSSSSSSASPASSRRAA